jgi:hypothetical protein
VRRKSIGTISLSSAICSAHALRTPQISSSDSVSKIGSYGAFRDEGIFKNKEFGIMVNRYEHNTKKSPPPTMVSSSVSSPSVLPRLTMHPAHDCARLEQQTHGFHSAIKIDEKEEGRARSK